MSCPDIKFDTENMFPGICTCSQQDIEVEDNTKMRMGNNTGFPRMNDRDIQVFTNSDNSINSLQNIIGSTSNQMKYFPSIASNKEISVSSKKFDNMGYSSPTEWKEHKKPRPPQTSGETNTTKNKKEGFTGNIFSSSNNSTNGPWSFLKFDKNDKKEGFCGCHSRPRFNGTVPYCCVAGVVVLVIILLFVLFKGCDKGKCHCKSISDNQLQGMINSNSFPLF